MFYVNYSVTWWLKHKVFLTVCWSVRCNIFSVRWIMRHIYFQSLVLIYFCLLVFFILFLTSPLFPLDLLLLTFFFLHCKHHPLLCYIQNLSKPTLHFPSHFKKSKSYIFTYSFKAEVTITIVALLKTLFQNNNPIVQNFMKHN